MDVTIKTSGGGPLTSDEVKAVSRKVDEFVKFKNPILEAIDGPAFVASIKALNDYALARLPEPVQEVFADIIRALIAEEAEG